MPFRITARTLLQLGAELISTDAIAFYELIKNAFDAQSRRVEIEIVVRLSYADIESAHSALLAIDRIPAGQGARHQEALEGVKRTLIEKSTPSVREAEDFRKQLEDATSTEEVREVLREANFILISDTGSGMSLKELDDVYLTIGTRARLVERERQRSRDDGDRPILGEKGLGRLSTMRLGDHLVVRSTKLGEKRWNMLNVDWSLFSHDSDALLETVEVHPTPGGEKDDPSVSGTVIRISGLKAEWTESRVRDDIAREISRYMDPLAPVNLFPVRLRFNGELIAIPRLNRDIFDAAHAIVTARLEVPNDPAAQPTLSGHIDYRLRKREKSFAIEGTHLRSAIQPISSDTLRTLGPFDMKLYWYNRRVLAEIEGIGDRKKVRDLVKAWGGGITIYRDGFRVNPYGSPDDDWLDLDHKALASGGYKVNRAQIIGKLEISADRNPELRDQTNREGLQETPEFRTLKRLLQHVVTSEFRTFLDEVDEDLVRKPLIALRELEQRVAAEEATVGEALALLRKRYPMVEQRDPGILKSIEAAAAEIRGLLRQVVAIADQYEQKRGELVHLAGLGLMVEILAHELNRAMSQALRTLEKSEGHVSGELAGTLSSFQEQLKTLHKRIRVMDPLSTSARQVKERFDLVDWTREIVSAHEAQFSRHGIRWSVTVVPEGPSRLNVRAVKGMVVQVIENLLSNSIYWLKQERTGRREFVPELHIVIDIAAREIRVTDNGPGVEPSRAEEIFQPFVTTKPPGQGKGLGLYIAREIARYHDGDLTIDQGVAEQTGRLNTFVFSLGQTV